MSGNKIAVVLMTVLLSLVVGQAADLQYERTLANGLPVPSVCSWDKALAGRPLIAGHFVARQCRLFAETAVAALQAKGIKAAVLSYAWKNGNDTDRHAFVVYSDPKTGKLLAIDNWMTSPKSVSGTTDKELAQNFDKHYSADDLDALFAPISLSNLLK